MTDVQAVLAVADRLVRDDERADGGDQGEGRERGQRQGGGDEGEQDGGAERPAPEDPPGGADEERDVPEQVERGAAAERDGRQRLECVARVVDRRLEPEGE